MELQRLLSHTRKAISDYNMIDNNDNIAIGLSGGKDSLTLLYALSNLKKFYDKNFSIRAVMVDLGFENSDFSNIVKLCDGLDVKLDIIKSDIYEIVFNIRKEKNPCSLCSKLRKGAFNDYIKKLGCNKLAYAHHKDDFIETFILSLFYEGRINTFKPVTYLDRTDLYLIRPLLYVNEKDIIGFSNKYKLPVFKNPCPADGYTKRQYAKDLLKDLSKEVPDIKNRIFHSIVNSNLFDWFII